MGEIAAVFSVIGALSGASANRRAGRRARAAAEENALTIEGETAENIKQMRRTQRQTLGMSKAIIASSGIRFDARKINRLRFSEGGTKEEDIFAGYENDEGETVGNDNAWGTRKKVYKKGAVEQAYGEQIDGDTEGSSAFQYLREMRRNFASDIGYMGKSGRSRARVARRGGQVAQAQASALATQGYVSAVNKFSSLFPSTTKKPD